MQRPPDIPRKPGIFALFHAATSEAYVNETGDLYQRASLWAMHLKRHETGEGLPPAKNFPKYPSAEWVFWYALPDPKIPNHLESARADFARAGWTIINEFKRPRKTYLIGGVDQSLAKHATARGLKFHTVYKRLQRGMSLQQALGDTAAPPVMDKRDVAIALMRIKIESENGGLLTYDEALMLRPELGDIRKKIQKMRVVNPQLEHIKLAEIAA